MSRRTGLRVVEGFGEEVVGEEVVGDDVVAEVVAAEDFDEEDFLVEDFVADSPGLEVPVRELVVDDGFSLDDCAAAPGRWPKRPEAPTRRQRRASPALTIHRRIIGGALMSRRVTA